MATLANRARPFRLELPTVAPDALILIGFQGFEAVSELFRFQLELAAPDPSLIAFEAILGKPVRFRIDGPAGQGRPFAGLCTTLTEEDRSLDMTLYRMEVRPELWLLTRRTNSRIFQRATVPRILRDVLTVSDVEFLWQDEGAYHPREYCVQYRETDYDFARRLMEEEGIRFYFRHHARGHQLVVTDTDASENLDPSHLIIQRIADDQVDEQRITDWSKSQRLRSGKVTLRDYNFALPSSSLEGNATIQESVEAGPAQHPLKIGRNAALELYDWPGDYAHQYDGVDHAGNSRPDELKKLDGAARRSADVRMRQQASGSVEVRGASKYRHLTSGFAFEVDESGAERTNGADPSPGPAGLGRYVLVSVDHRARSSVDLRSGETGAGDGQPMYRNTFTCVPASLPLVPSGMTTKPVIHGTQTAVIVGPSGEEIHTDVYGRVKVRFRWDRQGGKSPEDSSCWLRVAQIAAGTGFGAMSIPRVGQEVVVAFEEGDPDRPLVIGCVYNPSNMPGYSLGCDHAPAPPGAAYALPVNKTITGLKTNTYPGGGGSNEFLLDDAAGAEKVYLHAQRDYNSVVLNNKSIQVKANHLETIDQNKTMKVGVDHDEAIGANMTLVVGANRTATIQANDKETVLGNQDIAVTGNQGVTVTGNQSVTVVGNQNVMVRQMAIETVGAAKSLNVGGAYSIAVLGAMNTAVALVQAEEIGLTKTVVVGKKYELTCGAGSITVESSGKITIKGTEFLFEASGPVKVKGSVIDLN